MYNRYVRDADGNYRRQIMQKAPPEPQPTSRPETTNRSKDAPLPAKPHRQSTPSLFPISLETGDLLVILVLLLILTEGEDNDRTALLITIAAFLMMQ